MTTHSKERQEETRQKERREEKNMWVTFSIRVHFSERGLQGNAKFIKHIFSQAIALQSQSLPAVELTVTSLASSVLWFRFHFIYVLTGLLLPWRAARKHWGERRGAFCLGGGQTPSSIRKVRGKHLLFTIYYRCLSRSIFHWRNCANSRDALITLFHSKQ